MIGKLESMGAALKDLNERGARTEVIVEAYVVGRPDSVIPRLYLHAETLRRLAALEVRLAVDISLLEEDDS